MPQKITNTRVELNREKQLEITFTANSGSYDWSERKLADLIGSDPDVATIQVSIERTECKSDCTVRATPVRGARYRDIARAIRIVVADLCDCDLGDISFNEAYDRRAEEELKSPEVLPASDVGMFDEGMPVSR